MKSSFKRLIKQRYFREDLKVRDEACIEGNTGEERNLKASEKNLF
jgi:hypothetical protein